MTEKQKINGNSPFCDIKPGILNCNLIGLAGNFLRLTLTLVELIYIVFLSS